MPLLDLIIHGIIDDICFVDDKGQPCNGFEDQDWNRWLRFIQRPLKPPNVFVVLFENGTSTSAVDDALTSFGIRTFTIKATDSTAEFGSGPESIHAATKLLRFATVYNSTFLIAISTLLRPDFLTKLFSPCN